MKSRLAVLLMLLFCFEASSFAASPGWRYRNRRGRTRYNVQRNTNYRYYNYQRRTTTQSRATVSKDPWWMSEPGFRSQRTRTLLEFSGYPYAFD